MCKSKWALMDFIFVFLTEFIVWKHYLQNVLITSSGAWKLAGFGFATSADSSTGEMANVQAFHYAVREIFKLTYRNQ